jgi:phage shock protein A
MADEPTQQDDAVEAAAPAAPAQPAASIPVPPVDTGYTASGVPTFESVREKIETRYGTALGSAELDAETPEGRSAEEQYEARQRAAHDKLEEIRASMHQQDKP